MDNKIRLHLGSGLNYLDGYLNCDISNKIKIDKLVNLEKELDWQDDCVEEIIIEHTLEHIENIHQLFQEFYRVCCNGAKIKIKVPYFAHESAFSTMSHCRFFSYTTFDMLDKNHICHWQEDNFDFVTIKKRLNWRKQLFWLNIFNLCPRIYQELWCWIFPARELEVVLEVRK